MNFYAKLNHAIAVNRSRLVVGLDPNPEMMPGGDESGEYRDYQLADLRAWLQQVVVQTGDRVCAYKPTLGFFIALGQAGLELLEEILRSIPAAVPVILDAKHGDLNTSTAIARLAFERWQVDAIVLDPFAGQDGIAPFSIYSEKGIFVNCHTSNPSATEIQNYPSPDRPLYQHISREARTWGTPDTLGFEVGTADAAILGAIRQIAPERLILARSIWSEGSDLEAIVRAGSQPNGEGLLLPVPQDWLRLPELPQLVTRLNLRLDAIARIDRHRKKHPVATLSPSAGANATHATHATHTAHAAQAEPIAETLIPGLEKASLDPGFAQTSFAQTSFTTAQVTPAQLKLAQVKTVNQAKPIADRPSTQAAALEQARSLQQTTSTTSRQRQLIRDLYANNCILFGEFVQSAGETFPYYIDLRQIISTPPLFQQVLHAYAEILETLHFDRIAGIPYGSLPTATGLSLMLHYPMIFPRKEVKAHGTRRLIEGEFHPGETIVVIDDVLITGKSIVEGIGKLESAGITVRDVVVLIDHERGVTDRIRNLGYTPHAVVTLSQISRTLYELGLIDEEQLAKMQHIVAHPRS